MIFTETKLKGAFVVEIKKLEDERGFFGRAWCQQEFEAHGIKTKICQINTSFTKKKGTIRGVHFQVDPYQEAKFIRCTKGRIFDVMVDLRPDSPTFLQWVGNELSEDNYKMAYVPENFAHGFVSLVDNCEVYYPVSQFYTPGAERGMRWNDPVINIKWPIDIINISDKDKSHPDFDLSGLK
ncbi:MAG: dTDP-4-dehydrorhamnose 3,5-epimerase [Bacteroidales bacterium]|nr:dTDP-4-dehydrorhamnose 3,5-epimerase [Bacteroidales bacterium]